MLNYELRVDRKPHSCVRMCGQNVPLLNGVSNFLVVVDFFATNTRYWLWWSSQQESKQWSSLIVAFSAES